MFFDSRINILIPMAGKGQRFVDAGYKTPKPFIPIPPYNTPMLQSIIANLYVESMDQKFIFVVKQITDEQKTQIKRWVHNKPVEFVDVVRPQMGQTFSCLEAKNSINNSTPLLIANSDQLVGEKDWQQRFFEFIKMWQPEGCITIFPNDHPKWSYARVKNNTVVETAEKRVISDMATCGHYYFVRGSDFVSLAEEQIQQDETVNNEFYICPLYNKIIQAGGTVRPYLINNFIGLGTPEDLNRYESGYRRYNF